MKKRQMIVIIAGAVLLLAASICLFVFLVVLPRVNKKDPADKILSCHNDEDNSGLIEIDYETTYISAVYDRDYYYHGGEDYAYKSTTTTVYSYTNQNALDYNVAVYGSVGANFDYDTEELTLTLKEENDYSNDEFSRDNTNPEDLKSLYANYNGTCTE